MCYFLKRKIENVSFKILLGLFTGRKCIKDKNFKFNENWKELIDAYDLKASNENTEELINGEKILFFSKSDDSKLQLIKNFSYLNYGVHSESANYKFFRGSQKCKYQLSLILSWLNLYMSQLLNIYVKENKKFEQKINAWLKIKRFWSKLKCLLEILKLIIEIQTFWLKI